MFIKLLIESHYVFKRHCVAFWETLIQTILEVFGDCHTGGQLPNLTLYSSQISVTK